MKNLKNVNLGLSEDAIDFLYQNSRDSKFSNQFNINKNKFVHFRSGFNNSVKLHKYLLNDGTYAEEFVQLEVDNEFDQVYFMLGLRFKNNVILWKKKEIEFHLSKKFGYNL